MKFKVGDKVRCILPGWYGYEALNLTDEYEIESIEVSRSTNNQYVSLKNILTRGFRSSRFELVIRKFELPEELFKI